MKKESERAVRTKGKKAKSADEYRKETEGKVRHLRMQERSKQPGKRTGPKKRGRKAKRWGVGSESGRRKVPDGV